MNISILYDRQPIRLVILTVCTASLMVIGCARDPRHLVSEIWDSDSATKSAEPERATFASYGESDSQSTGKVTANAAAIADPFVSKDDPDIRLSQHEVTGDHRSNIDRIGRARVATHTSVSDPFADKSWSRNRGRSASSETRDDTRAAKESRRDSLAQNREWPRRRSMPAYEVPGSSLRDTDADRPAAQTLAAEDSQRSALHRRVMQPTAAEVQRDRWDDSRNVPSTASDREFAYRQDVRSRDGRRTRDQRSLADQRPASSATFSYRPASQTQSDIPFNGMVVESSRVDWRFPDLTQESFSEPVGRSTVSDNKLSADADSRKQGGPTHEPQLAANFASAWQPLPQTEIQRASANQSVVIHWAEHSNYVEMESTSQTTAGEKSTVDQGHALQNSAAIRSASMDEVAPAPPRFQDATASEAEEDRQLVERALKDVHRWNIEAEAAEQRPASGPGFPLILMLVIGIVGLATWVLRRHLPLLTKTFRP